VKADENGGFLFDQKAFNGHLPLFSGKHLPRLPLSDKIVHKPFHP
jgi:hypothetical protein